MGTPINHGINTDQNIIVQAEYDKAGRMISQRNPNGQVSTFEYDLLDRRTKRTRGTPEWLTSYQNLTQGQTQTVTTMPGLASGSPYNVTRTFDGLGRLTQIDYDNHGMTPDVAFSYDLAGNRTRMDELDVNSALIRQTQYTYDQHQRLLSVAFDANGDGTPEQTVGYIYDPAGRRTQLTLPDGKIITYNYDELGQLQELTDWHGNRAEFAYDGQGRHHKTTRYIIDNGQESPHIVSSYFHDLAGRLKSIQHGNDSWMREYSYPMLDGLGNRISAWETQWQLLQHDDASITYSTVSSLVGPDWSTNSEEHFTNVVGAYLEATFSAESAQLVMSLGQSDVAKLTLTTGTGTTVSYLTVASLINGTYQLALSGSGPHTVKLEYNGSGYNNQNLGLWFYGMRIQSAAPRSISYQYDNLSRLLVANTNSGERKYEYSYDRAGNRLMEKLTGTEQGLAPFTTNYTYNALNQLVSDGSNTFTYDANGNLTNDGANSYTWDRANRMLSIGNHSYAYDGQGNRISKTVGGTVTDYLLDVQTGLVKVLAETTGGNTQHYIHSPQGIHAQRNASSQWHFMLNDGLGSVRAVVDHTMTVIDSARYSPYGVPEVTQTATPMGFTGEQTDANGQLYLRARYYNPGMGIFPALDPFEGDMNRPMSLNGYSWVEGNVVNRVDRLGRTPEWPYTGCEDKTSLAEFVRCRAQTVGNPCPIGWTDVSDSFHYLCQKDGVVMAPENAWTGTTPPRSHQELLLFTAAGLAGIPSLPLLPGAIGTGVSTTAWAIGTGVKTAAAAAVRLPLWAKLGLIGGGGGYVSEVGIQTSENLQNGLSFWEAISSENLDYGRINQAILYGALNGVLWDKGTFAVRLAQGFGAVKDTASQVLSNLALGNDLFSGVELDLGSSLSDAFWTGILGYLPTPVSTQDIVSYGMIGVLSSGSQELVDNILLGEKPDISSIVSIFSGSTLGITASLGDIPLGIGVSFATDIMSSAYVNLLKGEPDSKSSKSDTGLGKTKCK